MNKKINIMAAIKDGIAIALVNFFSVLAAIVLYLLTFWIPYLNVGTTVAISSLPALMAKGGAINPLFIFESKYRKNMGEFFILTAHLMGGVSLGFMFTIIPGLVLSIAWSYASVLFVDKDLAALESLHESNRITYGNKWRIFWTNCLIGLIICIASGIVVVAFCITDIEWLNIVGLVLIVLIVLFSLPATFGVKASVYKQLIAEDAAAA